MSDFLNVYDLHVGVVGVSRGSRRGKGFLHSLGAFGRHGYSTPKTQKTRKTKLDPVLVQLHG